MKEETFVISLGGSLIIPDNLDVEFLKDFRKLILSHVEQGKKFAIITGGGKLCRRYNEAASKISSLSNTELDWLGIYSTRFNAEFIRLIFGEKYTEKEIIINPTLPVNFTKSIIIGSGWEPGNSTDLDAVLVAKTIGAKRVINLSNIDHVYDSDPKVNPNAKKIDKISWVDYRKVIPSEWRPGLNSPFDPVASREAEESGIEVVIMNGKPIENLENCLDGKNFQGTVIS